MTSVMALNKPFSGETPPTLGEFATSVIERQFSKVIKGKEEVLEDLDPEPIHQMRVATRRLRTALNVFHPFVALEHSIYSDLVKTAKCLRSVRDLDVLALHVQQYQSQLAFNQAEQDQMHLLLQKLNRKRQKQFKQLSQAITGSQYLRWVSACKKWLSCPQFQFGAQWSLSLALPDVLMPSVNEWLMHPGWLIGPEPTPDTAQALTPTALKAAGSIDHHTTFHDLRKLTKQVRYQSEFCAAFYGPPVQLLISEFKEIQEFLGEQQDGVVLGTFLRTVLGPNWSKKLPTLNNELRQKQQSFEHQWQPIQQKYLNSEVRHQMRLQWAGLP